jgi:tRNA(adenine34) deaminase
VFGQPTLNHHTEVVGGVLAAEAGEVLRSFFAERREQYRQRRAAPTVLVEADPDAPAPTIPAGESVEIDADPGAGS